MSKIEREKRTIELMIRIYCEKNHNCKESKDEGHLCEQCSELLEYAQKRLSYCKFGEEKSTCSRCPIHCYKKDMKEKIKEVMRFSGPRLIIYKPGELIRHILNK